MKIEDEFRVDVPIDEAWKVLLDVERINALGWKAKIGLREGIESTYAWFLAHSRAPVATP